MVKRLTTQEREEHCPVKLTRPHADGELPTPRTFPYGKYLSVKEKRDRFISEWSKGRVPGDAPVLVLPPYDLWSFSTCSNREDFLALNLLLMAESAEWSSDTVFPHLEPWYGVGIYASAFGCTYHWDGDNAPQVRPIYSRVEEVLDVKKPDLSTSTPMKEVMERISWYKKVTGNQLPICLTDTQSPNDTASLILATNEFLVASSYYHRSVEHFLNVITDVIIEFTEMQMERIGENLSLPGHNMLCCPGWPGISVCDDNMVFYSPGAYQLASMPYNSRIAQRFGGIAVHSCGNFAHNVPALLKTPQLRQVEGAVDVISHECDPSPNEPEAIRDGYRGHDVVVNMRLHKSELDLLDRLLAPDLKCVVNVRGVESRGESEQVYQLFKERIRTIASRWK
jgi:hypothetical protein